MGASHTETYQSGRSVSLHWCDSLPMVAYCMVRCRGFGSFHVVSSNLHRLQLQVALLEHRERIHQVSGPELNFPLFIGTVL